MDRHLEGFVVTPALRLGRPAVEGAYQRLVARAAAHRQEHGGRRHEREREDGQTGLSVQRREETKTKKKNNRKLDALSTFVSRPPDWSMDAVGHGTPPPFVPHFRFPLLVPGPTIKHGPCCVSIARPLIGRWSRKGKEIPPLMSRIMSFYFFRKSGRVANQGLFS